MFHDIFKYIVFQRRQKALSWGKGLACIPETKFSYRKIKHCAVVIALDQNAP